MLLLQQSPPSKKSPWICNLVLTEKRITCKFPQLELSRTQRVILSYLEHKELDLSYLEHKELDLSYLECRELDGPIVTYPTIWRLSMQCEEGVKNPAYICASSQVDFLSMNKCQKEWVLEDASEMFLWRKGKAWALAEVTRWRRKLHRGRSCREPTSLAEGAKHSQGKGLPFINLLVGPKLIFLKNC